MSSHEPAPSLDAVEARLTALEERIAHLEKAASGAPGLTRVFSPPESLVPSTPLETPSAVPVLGGIGRVFLILGGAFFLRALTEGGTLPRPVGVALGLTYALVWAFLAWRTQRPADAGFHTLSSILIAYPLLYEATTTFAVVSVPGSVALLLALAAIHLGVSWRRNLEPLAWASTLAVTATGLALVTATHAIELFSFYFLVLGAGVLWLTYGRRWHGLRWPTALAADGSILILTVLAAWHGGPPEAYRGLNSTRALLLAMALPVLYITSFAWRMLRRQRVVNAFEGIQTALALLIGFGGAVRITMNSGSGTGVLGVSVLVAGAGYYAAAFSFVADQEEVRANFNFFTSLGLVFLLLGTPVLMSLPAYGLVAASLGLASVAMGLRFRRTVLLFQGVLCLGVASVASGLLMGSIHAFVGSLQELGGMPGAAWMVSAALIVTCLLVEIQRPSEGFPTRLRIAVFLVGTLCVLTVGGEVLILTLHLGGQAFAQPTVLAFLRTAVLSAAAIALAVHSRHCPCGEFRWLAYPVLGAACLKFLLEDMPLGHPMTLFLALMCLGTALILTPRLLKTQEPPQGADPEKV